MSNTIMGNQDQEERIVFNYLDGVIEASVESETVFEAESKQDESFDENQNKKFRIKKESKVTLQKKLMVILEQSDLILKKLSFSTKKNRRIRTASCIVAPLDTQKKKRGRPSTKIKKIDVTKPKNGFKINLPVKSLDIKNFIQKKLEFPLLINVTKNNINSKKNQTSAVIQEIKVETEDRCETPVNNPSPYANQECEDVVVKYENENQIHTEFKYESLSETEEVMRKKNKVINPVAQRQNLLKSIRNQEIGKKQSTLDGFFKVVNAKQNGLKQSDSPINSIFKCDHCWYVGNSRANLERHNLIHKDPSDILWYKCTDCEYKSKYEHQLKSHTIIHKNPDDIYYFQCPHCHLKCSRKHNLTNHIRSIHADRINSMQCAECNYTTFCKDRLVAHVKKHSRQVFTCKMCKFVTKNLKYLETHEKLKHTEVDRPFLCDTCSYRGKTKRELDRHYDRMHNKEQLHLYQCNICKFNSIYKKNLQFHLLHMHLNSKGFQKFICGHCNKEFAYKNGLKTHIIRIHLKLTEDDWHKCQECKYKCKDVNTLKRHIKRNHGAPRLHCKKCSFATNRQISMTAHMRTHEAESEQILKCPECPYRILQATSFLYHMKAVHGKPTNSKDISKYYLAED